MQSIDPSIFAAISIGILACFLFRIYWEELDVGQRIFSAFFSGVLMFAFIYVPFRIPLTGVVVHKFAWHTVEYPDQFMLNILIPEAIEEIERESPPGLLSQDWV
jgi:hypothetical protein